MFKQLLTLCSGLLQPVHRAETPEEREAVYRFRYQVYVEEFGRELGTPDHADKMVRDDDDEKSTTTILYTGSIDNVTGTVRLRHWRAGQVPRRDFEELSMSRFPDVDERNTAEIERLMVRPSKRGKLVIASLLRASYELLAAEQKTDLCFCYCSPGLVRYYQHLAMRPFGGRLVAAPDGMMVPLVAVMSDRAYYESTGSLLAPLVRKHFGAGKRQPLDITPYRELFAPGKAGIEFEAERVWHGVEAALRRRHSASLLADLPRETARALISQGLIIDVEPGTLVTRKGFCETELYVVLDGRFEATNEGRHLRTMGHGELFGEVAYFSPDRRRTASVGALTAGRLLILRGRSLDRLRRHEPRLAATFLRRLEGVMSERRTFERLATAA